MKITCYQTKILADLVTPVGLFLKVREKYSQVVLLESSDYASKKDSLSYLCFDSISSIEATNGSVYIDDQQDKNGTTVVSAIEDFLNSFEIENDNESGYNGLVGFTTFDAIPYFEDIEFDQNKEVGLTPELRYDLYRFIFVFDHFYNQLYLIENCPEGQESKLDDIKQLVFMQDYQTFNFSMTGSENSSLTDKQYIEMVTKAKHHCQQGDVFQMVLSRRFTQAFKGDEFNAYRALRSVNPSPYLFYFDYGSYKIFGSSPEAQIKVNQDKAEIHPIAGTFKRTGNYNEDQLIAQALKDDPKENSEHVMLVDLARNDLSKNCTEVSIESFKEVQFFSHVIHLVSKVVGKLKKGKSAFQVFADTFPAGTLSGAPKYKALQLINEYEPHSRSFYGGAIGLLHFNGNLNHAIVIRSFLSKGSQLIYQAGAGLVIDSNEEKELAEVNNKLRALKQSIAEAEKIAR